jgi:hypothetical protein
MSPRRQVFRLNPGPLFGVGLGMRDFAMDISRGLAAAGVFVSAVVHLTVGAGFSRLADWAAIAFALALAALRWPAMPERAA